MCVSLTHYIADLIDHDLHARHMRGNRQTIFKRAKLLAATLRWFHVVGHRCRLRIQWRLRPQSGMSRTLRFICLFFFNYPRFLFLFWLWLNVMIFQARDLAPRLVSFLGGWGLGVFRFAFWLFNELKIKLAFGNWVLIYSFRDYNWFWIFLVGPHVGAILGVCIFHLILKNGSTDISERVSSIDVSMINPRLWHHFPNRGLEVEPSEERESHNSHEENHKSTDYNIGMTLWKLYRDLLPAITAIALLPLPIITLFYTTYVLNLLFVPLIKNKKKKEKIIFDDRLRELNWIWKQTNNK